MAFSPLRERIRTEIRRTATQLFATRGYAATSLQDIGDAVGCSKGTVLYHIGSKDAVLAVVLGPSIQALSDLVADIAGLAPADAQDRAAAGLIDLVVRHRGLVPVIFEVAPEVWARTEYAELIKAADELPRILAGSTDEVEQGLARFAVSGLLAAARDLRERPDDDLHHLLSTALRRLLRPTR